jgi:hypothetical protein
LFIISPAWSGNIAHFSDRNDSYSKYANSVKKLYGMVVRGVSYCKRDANGYPVIDSTTGTCEMRSTKVLVHSASYNTTVRHTLAENYNPADETEVYTVKDGLHVGRADYADNAGHSMYADYATWTKYARYAPGSTSSVQWIDQAVTAQQALIAKRIDYTKCPSGSINTTTGAVTHPATKPGCLWNSWNKVSVHARNLVEPSGISGTTLNGRVQAAIYMPQVSSVNYNKGRQYGSFDQSTENYKYQVAKYAEQGIELVPIVYDAQGRPQRAPNGTATAHANTTPLNTYSDTYENATYNYSKGNRYVYKSYTK